MAAEELRVVDGTDERMVRRFSLDVSTSVLSCTHLCNNNNNYNNNERISRVPFHVKHAQLR